VARKVGKSKDVDIEVSEVVYSDPSPQILAVQLEALLALLGSEEQ
jgi:hypothetical protein